MKFTIPGNPIAKARARTVTRNGFTKTYDPQFVKKRTIQARLKCFIKQAFDSANKEMHLEASDLAFNHAYRVELNFYFRIPHSASKSERNAILWGIPHNSKPDLDNCEKFYLDCANGILFPDDSMIVSLSSKKFYSDKPRTEIDVMPLNKKQTHSDFDKIKKIFSPDELKEFLDYVAQFTKWNPKDLYPFNAVGEEYYDSQWTASLGSKLTEFAEKYGDILKKIAKEKKKEE